MCVCVCVCASRPASVRGQSSHTALLMWWVMTCVFVCVSESE